MVPVGEAIIDFLQTPTLFGAMADFKDLSTWTNWLVYLKALYGLPMSSTRRSDGVGSG